MIEINNLSCGYGEKIILHDINFKAEDGGFIGIIGPNGSGKTTLLRAISNILKPKTGKILLEEKNISQMKKYVMNCMVLT